MNELSCHLCGKLTVANQLRYGGSNWICITCYEKSGKKLIKHEVVQEKKNEPRLEFDPFTKGKDNFFIKNSASETMIKKERRDSGKKDLYKCLHCRFESRHENEDEICPNCGRYNKLTKVKSAAALLDEVSKNPVW